MPACHGLRGGPLVLVLVLAAAATPAAQPGPDVAVNIEALQDDIPAPPPVSLRPRLVAAYGALLAAAMLTVLYLYRGRAFIVYWIGATLLLAASLTLLGQGYEDVRLGRVMLGVAQLCSVWAAGLTVLAGDAFPDAPLRWNTPLRVAAGTAVWFLAAPFVLPTIAVFSTGSAAVAILCGWASGRYLRLLKRARYVGPFLVGAGLALIAASSGAGVVLGSEQGDNRLLTFNIIVTVFVGLGVHVLVFEDMTDELQRTNSELALANDQVRLHAITDPLTGCLNRRFFDEIERREMQRHVRYGAPLSVVFVDVNHFKRLNDTMGHDVGDRMLTMIGRLLRAEVRESDYVIRWGGDEFLLLLTCDLADARRKGDDLKRAFAQELETAALPAGVGLSVGVAPVSAEAPGLAEAIALADTRMYDEKLGRSPRTGAVR